MASSAPKLKVVYVRQVQAELGEIWDWNAEKSGAAHASDYVRYPEQQITDLGIRYGDGKVLIARAHFMGIAFRRGRKRNAHAHVAIYSVDRPTGTVTVLHIFHTAQDIEGRLGSERY